MRVQVTDVTAFEAGVFGAESFLRGFPHITTEGVPVIHHGDYYYITIDGKTPIDGPFRVSSCFFSDEELNGDNGCKLIE